MTKLTEFDCDEIWRLKEELHVLIHNLLDEHLKDAPPEVADEVRQDLTEQFRF